ncbi:MAG: hypothetical protein [Bacteriophage sp.]|nr:MAG: hypothetical protein [Bacteriophage sp.]
MVKSTVNFIHQHLNESNDYTLIRAWNSYSEQNSSNSNFIPRIYVNRPEDYVEVFEKLPNNNSSITSNMELMVNAFLHGKVNPNYEFFVLSKSKGMYIVTVIKSLNSADSPYRKSALFDWLNSNHDYLQYLTDEI